MPNDTTNKKAPAKTWSYKPKAKPKKFVERIIPLKPVDEVKAFFRTYFKQNCTAGHIMTKEAVIKHVLRKLTAKEDAVFADALNELKKSGHVEVQDDGVSIMLTQKGADSFAKKA